MTRRDHLTFWYSALSRSARLHPLAWFEMTERRFRKLIMTRLSN
jgi:hypothetical protein